MAIFKYEATDSRGAIITGEFEAESKAAVVDFLERKSLTPMRIKEAGELEERPTLSISIFDKITPLDRIVFVRNLAAAVKAGLSLTEALDILIADTEKRSMKNILIQAKVNLQNGEPLSQTFGAMRNDFPPVFVGLMRAGEYSGKLDSSLNELEGHLAREYGLTQKVKSALMYPLILVTAATAVVTLLVLFVVPRLATAFKQSKVKLPLITQVLVNFSLFVGKYRIWLGIGIFVLIIFFLYFRKTKKGRKFLLSVAFHTPILKELAKKIALVRLTRSLGSLIASGVSLIESLKLSAQSVANDYYEAALLDSMSDIEEGVSFAETLKKYPNLFPLFLTSLMVVGERTGTLENVLKKFADFYDDEVDNTLKNLTSTLEPILLLIMGVIVGSIALSVLLPIYQLVGSFR